MTDFIHSNGPDRSEQGISEFESRASRAVEKENLGIPLDDPAAALEFCRALARFLAHRTPPSTEPGQFIFIE